MKIQIASDLHLEMQRSWREPLEELYTPEPDVLILAGDIMNKRLVKDVFDHLAPLYRSILYVPGNHEYFKSSIPDMDTLIKNAIEPYDHIHRLGWKTPPVVIDGQRFLGDTLWYPKTPETYRLKGRWIDFHQIMHGSPDIFDMSAATYQYLDEHLQEGDIVVTHMAPSHKSVVEFFKGNEYNVFFANELDALIRDRKPKLWTHGHMHDPSDYLIGDTRIIANPRGYRHMDEGSEYQPKLIVETPQPPPDPDR